VRGGATQRVGHALGGATQRFGQALGGATQRVGQALGGATRRVDAALAPAAMLAMTGGHTVLLLLLGLAVLLVGMVTLARARSTAI
jgi:uncharacterized membrane protein YecN with MAPEG domain